MTALFRINQAASVGTYGRARDDLTPFSVGGLVTFQAQTLTHHDYTWEVIGSPIDGVAPVLVSVGVSCTMNTEERGGYLIRLTVDAGMATEDVSVLYAGIPLMASGLALPAVYETNYDNSVGPSYDGSQGWWYKLERWLKWADPLVGTGSGGFVSQYVYCDSIDGSDVTGDGTPGNPYKTFAFACTQQPAPTTTAIFQRPLGFILAPGGDYPGPVTLPSRLHVTVQGDDCSISGTINWGIDPKVWSDLGLATSNVPVLEFARTPSVPAVEMDTNSFAPYAQGFQLEGGHLDIYNAFPGAGFAMPDWHVVSMVGVIRNGFGIHNVPAGTGVALDDPVTLKLYLTDSTATAGSSNVIAAESDSDGMVLDEGNAVWVHAMRSDLTLRGLCRIELLEECNYSVDRTLDYAGNPYSYGKIDALPGAKGFPSGVIRNSIMTADSVFGCDDSAIPAYTNAVAVTFDRDSLLSMADVCSDLDTTFAGFPDVEYGAFGRGWWFGVDEQMGDHAVTRIPCAGSTNSYRLLLHAYDAAVNWLPFGNALSTTNRLAILLEAGQYHSATKRMPDFEVDTDFVDIIGSDGSSVEGEATIAHPPAVSLWMKGTDFIVSAQDVRLEGFELVQNKATPNASCMIVSSEVHFGVFKHLYFSAATGGAGDVYAVTIDPLLAGYVCGVWEDCHTLLTGFLYGGSIYPTAMRRCSAADLSFAAWEGDTDLNVECNGVLEDCEGGDYSYAAVCCTGLTGGGNALFSGTATRCKVSSYGFGHTTSNEAGPFTGECSGVLIDCDNCSVGGEKSFGYSSTGAGVASGVFIRCTGQNNSFGCSSSATGSPLEYGEFSGTAEDCSGANRCFGSNDVNATYAKFSGTAKRCRADAMSFGARGELQGSAYYCDGGSGSFGDTQTYNPVTLDHCTMTDIQAKDGTVSVFGAVLKDCMFLVRAGENIAALFINGGVNLQATRVLGCTLYSDTAANCIMSTGGTYNIQVMHSTMNTDLDTALENLITSDPYNVVNTNWFPYDDWPH